MVALLLAGCDREPLPNIFCQVPTSYGDKLAKAQKTNASADWASVVGSCLRYFAPRYARGAVSASEAATAAVATCRTYMEWQAAAEDSPPEAEITAHARESAIQRAVEYRSWDCEKREIDYR